MAWLFAIGVLLLIVYSPGFRKIAVALVVLLATSAGAYWAWTRYQDRPRRIDELDGLRLQMTPLDVKLAKGAPNGESEARIERVAERFELRWLFTPYGRSLSVLFSGDSENSLHASVLCEAEGYSRVFGLGSHSSESDIIKRLGTPSSTSIAEDGLSKFVSFEAYNVAFRLQKGTVGEICVAENGVRYTREYQQ